MKKFISGFVSALILIAVAYYGYPAIRGFVLGFSDQGKPLTPSELTPGATAFGNLKVEVTSDGKAVANLEVDLGKPGGRMSYIVTDDNGIALFEKVSVGTYNIFFNNINFPKNLTRLSSAIPVEIKDGVTTEKNIELKAKPFVN